MLCLRSFLWIQRSKKNSTEGSNGCSLPALLKRGSRVKGKGRGSRVRVEGKGHHFERWARSPSGACNFHTASMKRRFHK